MHGRDRPEKIHEIIVMPMNKNNYNLKILVMIADQEKKRFGYESNKEAEIPIIKPI